MGLKGGWGFVMYHEATTEDQTHFYIALTPYTEHWQEDSVVRKRGEEVV